MAASPTAVEKQNALAQANAQKTAMDSALSAGNYDADLIAQIVPVRYKIVVVKNPASVLSDAQAKAVADTLNIEFYEES